MTNEHRKATEQLQSDLDHIEERLALREFRRSRAQQRLFINLVTFARGVMKNWPEGDVDGGELQDIAAACGLLRPVTVEAPCSDHDCSCADYGDFPTTCYRRHPILTDEMIDIKFEVRTGTPPPHEIRLTDEQLERISEAVIAQLSKDGQGPGENNE